MGKFAELKQVRIDIPTAAEEAQQVGIFDELFRGRSKPEPLSVLRDRIALLCEQGRFKDAVRDLERHRFAADRHYEHDQVEKIYQNGVAHFLAIRPLNDLARSSSGEEAYSVLSALFASYYSMIVTFSRIEEKVSAERKTLISQHRNEASETYDAIYDFFGADVCDPIDTGAATLVSNAARGRR